MLQFFNWGTTRYAQAPNGIHYRPVFVYRKSVKRENARAEEKDGDVEQTGYEAADSTGTFGHFEEIEKP
jgi:hypothetical protein